MDLGFSGDLYEWEYLRRCNFSNEVIILDCGGIINSKFFEESFFVSNEKEVSDKKWDK